MDVDDFFQSMPSADMWKMLWDADDGAKGLSIKFESSLVDNLLTVMENESVDQDSPIICDRCTKVGPCLVRLTMMVNLKCRVTPY
jgi:hypothetical protein